MAKEKNERFIRMSHKCYEALYTLPMSDGERRVLMMIVRFTVGFHRYDCEFADRFAAKRLGMSYSGINRCVKALIEKGYIYTISPGCGRYPRKIGLNYKQISAHFQRYLRSLSEELALTSDTVSAHSERAKKVKENKNKEKKNKERFASEPSSLFSPDPTEIDEQEQERELTDEEWYELHKNDPDDEEDDG